MRTVLQRKNRRWLIGVLLMTFVVRALIPAGYMPASDRPFSLQICPDGFPAQWLKASVGVHAHHHVAHDHAHDGHGEVAPDETPGTSSHGAASSEKCVFAAAAGATPPALTFALATLEAEATAPEVIRQVPVFESLRFRTPPSRGPPALS